jgi:hypothetical protein
MTEGLIFKKNYVGFSEVSTIYFVLKTKSKPVRYSEYLFFFENIPRYRQLIEIIESIKGTWSSEVYPIGWTVLGES